MKIEPKAILAAGCLALLFGTAPAAADKEHKHGAHGHGHGHAHDERREHGAHEHGHARLAIGLEGQTLSAELEVPGMDVVGFEHPPKSDGDKAAVAAALERLEDAGAMFDLPAAAGCAVTEAHAEHEIDDDGDHSEFHAHYSWNCSAPAKLDAVEVRHFEHFPGTEEIEAQIVGPNGQSAQELEPGETTIKF